jgi:hypothetical protein
MCFSSPVKSADGTKAAAICFQQYGLSQAIALLPVAYQAKRITGRQLLANLGWVYLGNLLRSVCYGGMFALTLSLSSAPQTTIGPLLIVAAEAKTIAYASHGLSGLLVCVVKAVLCNWMVCLGVIAAMTSNLGTWQDHRFGNADLDLLCARIRALGREYVCDTNRDDPRSEGLIRGLVALESDPRHRWQPAGRLAVDRFAVISHLRQAIANPGKTSCH